MDGVKSLLASKTFWGAVMVIIAAALQFFGVTFGAEDQAAAVNTILTVVEAVGGAFAIYGRVTATKVIGKG